MVDRHDQHDLIGGRRVHWREWGDAAAEPLVFLHGAWVAAAFYDTFSERFGATRHVFALDQRGHGETDHAPNYSWPLWLEDLAAFTDHVGVGHFDLVGHSMGAGHAVRFAGRYPSRVRRLVLLEGGFGPFTSPQQDEFWSKAFRLVPENGFESLDAYIDLVCELFPRSGRADVRSAAAHFEQRPDGRWQWPFPADFNWLTQTDPTADEERGLHRAITARTLVVQASASELFIGDAYAEFAASLADGQSVLLPDAGHNLQWENVAGSTELILDFLD